MTKIILQPTLDFLNSLLISSIFHFASKVHAGPLILFKANLISWFFDAGYPHLLDAETLSNPDQDLQAHSDSSPSNSFHFGGKIC